MATVERRPLVDIDADLAKAQHAVRLLRHERKCLLISEKSRARHLSDPAFRYRLADAQRRNWSDPAYRAEHLPKMKARLISYRLPKMTEDQRRTYRKLRREIPREQALAGALT